MTRVHLTALAVTLLASGCLDIDFDPPHLIKTPRILAIQAEPPEVAFGGDVVFEALLVDFDGAPLADQPGVELVWTTCISLREVVAASGLGAGSGLDDNCDEGGDDLVRLETEGLPPGTALLPGTAFTRLLTMLPMGGEPMPPPPGGGEVDPELIETLTTVIAEVGVPLRVRLEVFRDGELILSGFKRFAITQRADPTTNPPPPRAMIGDVWVSARDGDDPHRCDPEEGALPVVAPEEEIAIDPDDDEEAWLESYPVFALSNSIQINEESAYYSWFVNRGAMADDITQRPLDDTAWTAPEEPGVYPLWVVVRDGHLGISWCRAEIEVR